MRTRIEVSATGKNLFSQPKCLGYFWSVGRSAIEDEQSNSVDVLLAVSSILMHNAINTYVNKQRTFLQLSTLLFFYLCC